MYSVRRRKETAEVLVLAFPKLASGRSSRLSASSITGFGDGNIAVI